MMKRKTLEDSEEAPSSKKVKFTNEEVSLSNDMIIPFEMWSMIFSYLEFEDIYNCQYVSKLFHQVYQQSFSTRIEGRLQNYLQLLEKNKEKVTKNFYSNLTNDQLLCQYYIPQTAQQLGLENVLLKAQGKEKLFKIRLKNRGKSLKPREDGYYEDAIIQTLDYILHENLSDIPHYFMQSLELANIFRTYLDFTVNHPFPALGTGSKKLTLKVQYNSGWNGRESEIEDSFCVIIGSEDPLLLNYLLENSNPEERLPETDYFPESFKILEETGRALLYYSKQRGELDGACFYAKKRIINFLALMMHESNPKALEETIRKKLNKFSASELYSFFIDALFSLLQTQDNCGSEYRSPASNEFEHIQERINETMEEVMEEENISHAFPIRPWKSVSRMLDTEFPFSFGSDFEIGKRTRPEHIFWKLVKIKKFQKFLWKLLPNSANFAQAAGLVVGRTEIAFECEDFGDVDDFLSDGNEEESSAPAEPPVGNSVREKKRQERQVARKKVMNEQSKAYKKLYPRYHSFKEKAMKLNPLLTDSFLKLVNFAEATALSLESGEYSNMAALRGNVFFKLPTSPQDFLKVHYSFEHNWIYHDAPYTYTLLFIETSSEDLRKRLKMKKSDKRRYLISDQGKPLRMEGGEYSHKPCAGEVATESCEINFNNPAIEYEDSEDEDEWYDDEFPLDEMEDEETLLAKLQKGETMKPLASVWCSVFPHDHMNVGAFVQLFRFLRKLDGDKTGVPPDLIESKAVMWLLQFIEIILLQHCFYYAS